MAQMMAGVGRPSALIRSPCKMQLLFSYARR